MSDKPKKTFPGNENKISSQHETTDENVFSILDECLASISEDSPHQEQLYKIRHHLLQEGAKYDHQKTELKKLETVVEKLTAPANRIGTLLDIHTDGLVQIFVGGSEFYTNLDPRLSSNELKRGAQVLINESYTVIKTLGYDRSGPIVKIGDVLKDGRLRIDQEPGRPGVFLSRGSDLEGLHLKPGDEIRLDPSHRLAIEYVSSSKSQQHLLDEPPSVSWEEIGGQEEAISSIRRAIEHPLLHARIFSQYDFSQPKGFLLYGPPGCGKTLIGQATANSLAQLLKDPPTGNFLEKGSFANAISSGAFLHIKGPEILNMWVGESERIIRDLFQQARERRKAGALPFLFIDEAESILGTRRAMRSYNISNTLVPMFCAELDGIESLRDVVVILASNRPDLIDPAILRPGRIDRKIKIRRPSRREAENILRIYLPSTLPFDKRLLKTLNNDSDCVRDTLIDDILGKVYSRDKESRVLSIRLRNGKREILYRDDVVSGAILASIVCRIKELAIKRTIADSSAGILRDDVSLAVENEYAEGGILPPDDSAEEWLKLLDHHPDQVVGISPLRNFGMEQELLVKNIV